MICLLYDSPCCFVSFIQFVVVTVEFSQLVYDIAEEAGIVEVCLTLDTPTATPLTISVEAEENTPTSATGT